MARDQYASAMHEKAVFDIQTIKEKLASLCEQLDAIPCQDMTPAERDGLLRAVRLLESVDDTLGNHFT